MPNPLNRVSIFILTTRRRDSGQHSTQSCSRCYQRPMSTGCFACITLPNDASIALHTRFGFREVGRFSEAGFKFGEYRDVLWMEKAMQQDSKAV